MTDLETVNRLRLVVNNDRLEKMPERTGITERAMFLMTLIVVAVAVYFFAVAIFALSPVGK